MDIAANISAVKDNIKEACERSGRDASDVTLIAVSKTKPVSAILEAYDAGCRDFGENKVQEIMDKYDKLPDDIRWHMIGHLQTNKVKYIIDKVYMIHSVDSIKLADMISKEAVKHGVTAKILLEVNVAEEESKFGADTEGVRALYEHAASLPGIEVCGLMTVAPYTVDAETNRQYFVVLRQLSVDIIHQNKDNDNSGHPLDKIELSMGMTGDYQVAAEEGATMVRVGTGIFGERDYSVTN
ncbi:MAG: YggS family pyridoxal phosphate-dependent enzyme [Lachnospiraceae bacterium]|nr:YggS family pyridoxal phosphate-dependent enzyme [Lachnospiraceae bacterium]